MGDLNERLHDVAGWLSTHQPLPERNDTVLEAAREMARLTTALEEAKRGLEYIGHGDILEGIQPSDPAREACATLTRIESIQRGEANDE